MLKLITLMFLVPGLAEADLRQLVLTSQESGQRGYRGDVIACDFAKYKKEYEEKFVVSTGNGSIMIINEDDELLVDASGMNGADNPVAGGNGENGGDGGVIHLTVDNENLLDRIFVQIEPGLGGQGGPGEASGGSTLDVSSGSIAVAARSLFSSAYGARHDSSVHSSSWYEVTFPGSPGRDGRQGQMKMRISPKSCERVFKEFGPTLRRM